MKNIYLSRILAFILSALAAAGFAACSDDDTDASDFRLYYRGVSNIGPSASMDRDSGAPSYYGGTPSDFAITKVTFDDAAFDWEQTFSVDAETGVITIHNSPSLSTGTYRVSVSCRVGGATLYFHNAWEVFMIAARPSDIVVEPERVEVDYALLLDEQTRAGEIARATAKVKPVGEAVSITAYELEQEEGKDYFTVDAAGVISLNPKFKGEFPSGIHNLTVKIQTAALGSEWAVYENVAQFSVTSAPLALEYVPDKGMMEMTAASFESDPAVLTGSPEDVQYALLSVEPETDKISVNPETGAIVVAEGHGFSEVADYVVGIKVTNRYGSADFENVYTLSVVNYINPISAFAYDDAEVMQRVALTVTPKPDMVGDMVKFSFGEMDAALAQALSIDGNTGAVSLPKGHALPMGDYTVRVKAENPKGSAEAEFTLKVVDNPYIFTFIDYGNNLGLSPTRDYASQFRFMAQSELDGYTLTPTTDIRPGTEVEWSVRIVHNAEGTKIDAATGVVTMGTGAWKNRNNGAIFVTATTGKGTPAEVSMTVPVFFSYTNGADDIRVLYTPFVFRCNPRTGGTSVRPVLDGYTGDLSQFTLDYRRTFNYFDLGGAEEHGDGPSDKAKPETFLSQLWKLWFTSLNASVSYGGRGPVSYYNKTNSKETRDVSLGYVDPAQGLAFKVNPLKWTLDGKVYANGIFTGQMTYKTDGTDPQGAADPARIFPLWIWFDENF